MPSAYQESINLKNIAIILLLLIVAACSAETPAPLVPAAPVNSAQAQSDLHAYQQLIAAGTDEFAVTMGREILRKHPGSPAAVEVERTLAEVEHRANARTERLRLQALWAYQSTKSAGVAQRTASIYTSLPPRAPEWMRLILRRHAQWGHSAYVFGDGKGFVCGKSCTLPARIDGESVKLAAHSPETGEPAVFIDDDQGLIKRLADGAQVIEIDLRHVDRGPVTAVFEVGGYEDRRFLQLRP